MRSFPFGSYAKFVVTVVALAAAGMADAQDVQRRDRAPRRGAVLRSGAAVQGHGLVFPLTPSATPVRLDSEVYLGDEPIMTETRTASAGRTSVHLFSRAAGHFVALRHQDARKPGRVRVRILVSGEPAVDMSLTEFDAKYPVETPARPTREVVANGQCEDNCAFLYDDCLSTCDPQGQGCENCWRYYNDCMAACPDCDDWEEVSRTRIGRHLSGTANILGVQYCIYEEYYLVEQTNPAGCYPNRTVCDYDDDTVWYAFGSDQPTEDECCDENENSEHYCGGTTC